MKTFIRAHLSELVILSLIFIGTISVSLYSPSGKNLLYGDAVSRLNISRKLTDNLTPGIGQLGNVWLPLPELLMAPFSISSFLWRTGMSGTIISFISFVIGGYFIYKSLLLITKSGYSSMFGLAIYALNINLLYLQTTAMSESIFLCALAGIIYFLLKWFMTEDKHYLLLTAIAVSSLTLIRYEGLAILITSIPLIFLYTYFIKKKYSEAEGNTIIYVTLASIGFCLWTLYLAVIFRDPLYWVHYYAGGPAASSEVAPVVVVIHESGIAKLLGVFWKYLASMVWMLGLPAVVFSAIGFLKLLQDSYKRKTVVVLLPLLLPLSIILFMVATLMKNTPIEQPELNIINLLSTKTSFAHEFNIRYGILLLPWAAILAGYAFNIRNLFFKLLIILFFSAQLFSYFSIKYTLVFQLPLSLMQGNNKGTGNDESVKWLKQNYDGGLILVSALKHDPRMFWLGIDYKNYIHEGTQLYWTESLKRPQKYAKWILMFKPDKEFNDISDPVTKAMVVNTNFESTYDLVFSTQDILIYRIKTAPEIEVNNK